MKLSHCCRLTTQPDSPRTTGAVLCLCSATLMASTPAACKSLRGETASRAALRLPVPQPPKNRRPQSTNRVEQHVQMVGDETVAKTVDGRHEDLEHPRPQYERDHQFPRPRRRIVAQPHAPLREQH